ASGAGESLLAAAGGLFLVPLAWTLIEALGFRAAGVIGALLGLLATLFAARWIEWAPRSRRRVLAALAAAAAVAGAAAFLSAAFSRDAPQRATVVALVDGDSGTSRVLVETDADRLPREFAAAAEFRRVTPYPWAPAYSAFASEASRVALPPPELRIEGDAVAAGLRRIRGRLVSPRGASIVRIAFAPEAPVRGIAIGGVAAPPLSPAALRRGAGWRNYACVTVPAGGIPVEIVSAPGPVSLVIADRSAELPSAAAALAARRGAAAVPSQSGDGTIVFRKLTI
ncbi:MAG TPA: hypothetical protein VFL12_00245, partial [Thermoanaerobaculia bacterium]|nr:hypothetical protein [Thermoanaerobaculia bacterium]